MAGINSLNAVNNYGWLFGNNKNKKQDSISQLWSSYGNFQNNATGALAALNEINAGLKNVMTSYEDAKTAFQSEFSEAMENLSASAEKLKGYNFNVEKEGAITVTTSTDENGATTSTTTYSKEMQAALDTVKTFVDDYNSALKFFGEHSSVSKRIEQMATTFSDTTYHSANYSSIGLVPKADGSLTIDETKLADTILNDPDKVSAILGKNGLVGKTESHLSFANSQADKLFPSAQAMLGDQLDTASLYTGKAYRNMTAYSNMGNLINMMF